MTCTRRFLKFQWEHHRWRRRVTATHRVSTPVTEMWGRPALVETVHCHTDYVCDVCGKTRGGADCLCDAEKGDRCTIRQQFLAAMPAGRPEATGDERPIADRLLNAGLPARMAPAGDVTAKTT